ncbi:PepSY domain-containing protein [Moorellaceae bacterium AZ2]
MSARRRRGYLLAIVLLLAGFLVLVSGRAAALSAESISSEEGKRPAVPVEEGQKKPHIFDREALAIIREAFPYLPVAGTERIVLEEDGYRGRTVWRIDAEERLFYPPGLPRGYRAIVDATTGEILEMYWHPAPQLGTEETGGVISRDKARQIAENLARRLQPEKFAQMNYEPYPSGYFGYPKGPLSIAYHFSWVRTHKGIPVGDDGLRISVDAVTGLVTGYNLLWREDIKLPTDGPVLEANAIPARVAEKAGMVLVYAVFPGSVGGSPQVKLVYQVNSRYANLVDARTGDFLDFQGEPVKEFMLYAPEDYLHIRGEMNPPGAPATGVDPVKAREVAEKFFNALGYEGQVEQSGGGESSGPLGSRSWWSYVLRSEGQEGAAPTVGIDPATGEVVEFHHYTFRGQPSGPGGKRLTRDEALAVARDFIQKASPAYANHVALERTSLEWQQDPETYFFRFFRVVNGVPFPMDGMEVSISSDGRVVGYRYDWHRVTFPPAEGVISPAEAASKWVAHIGYRLKYYLPWTGDGRRKDVQAKLVYSLAPQVQAVDAMTGEVLGPDGRPVDRGRTGYDFRGSWAAEALELLAESGLLPAPEKFVPSAPVTRREAVRVLAAAARRYYGHEEVPATPSFRDLLPNDPDFGTVETAVALGILPKEGFFAPDKPLDRKTLAAWLVNAARYGEVASIPNRITSPFTDLEGLSVREQNYIGLAYGLGFMRGDGIEKFRPEDPVTWEELTAAVIRALPLLGGGRE